MSRIKDQRSTLQFFDSHTHVQFAAFKEDWKEVIERALQNDVWLINVGTQKDTSRRAVEIANEFKAGVYATVGLHPIHTEKSYHDPQELGDVQEAKGFTPTPERGLEAFSPKNADPRLVWGFTSRGEEFDYEYYKNLAQDPKVVAIGECGLDYYRLEEGDRRKAKSIQEEVFLKHIELAKEVGKSLMIHCRPSKGTDDAYEDLLSLIPSSLSLVPYKVVHFFVGSLAVTKKLLEAGFYFTFGGVITFVRDYDEAIKIIPLERILTETDAPYVTPEPYRGKRNEPVYVVEVVKKLAEIKGVSYDKMAEAITDNTKKVFKI